MSGGSDMSFLRGLRVPCAIAFALLLAAVGGIAACVVSRLVR
jgi:hypothetical protein